MKTLTINGQTFIVVDADAMKKIADTDLNMNGHFIHNVSDGVEDNDAATVGQLNAAVGDIETTLNRKTTYTNLYGRVEITADDIIAAGDEGITCITIGSDDVDLTPYNDIIIKFYIPISNDLNTVDGMLCIYATPTDMLAKRDSTTLLSTQSVGISTVCGISRERVSSFVVQSVWAQGDFLYGQVNRNGYSSSIGYAGAVNGWTEISKYFIKSITKYFHIIDKNSAFKFPAGTYVEVFAR